MYICNKTKIICRSYCISVPLTDRIDVLTLKEKIENKTRMPFFFCCCLLLLSISSFGLYLLIRAHMYNVNDGAVHG